MKRLTQLLAGTAIPLLLAVPPLQAAPAAAPSPIILAQSSDVTVRVRASDGVILDCEGEDADEEECADFDADAPAPTVDEPAPEPDATPEPEATPTPPVAGEGERAREERREQRRRGDPAQDAAPAQEAAPTPPTASDRERARQQGREEIRREQREERRRDGTAQDAPAQDAPTAEQPVTEPAAPPPTAEEPRVRERPVVQEPAREPTTETAPTAETAPVSPRRERVRDGDRNERIRPRDRDAARDDATQEPTAGTTTIQEPAATSAQEVEREPEGIQDVREGRRQRVQDGVTVIEEPGSRIILQLGDNLIIRQDQSENVRRSYRDVRRERRGEIEALVAPRTDGTAIITEVDEGGNLLRRIRRDADGRETVLIDNRREIRGERDARRGDRRGDRRDARRDDRRDPAGFAPYFGLRIDIAPPETRLPRERYIVEYGRVRRGEIIEAFESRPVADMRGGYALDEVLYSPDLRDYMVRVDLDTVTFDTGSWSLTRAQVDQLEELAEAMNAIIDRSPNEIFLVEGHTDAVGRAIDNLSLSDRRAETVAWVLTEYFDVPPENLVTQGYGEEFLKIDTQAAERQNRRVAVRRITPLLAMTP